MSAIGYVTREGDSFKGQLRTLTIRAAIEITPNPGKASDSHPDYRVSSEGIEVGAGWKRVGETSGNEYVALVMAAPEFGPRRIYANLGRAAGKDENSFAIIWNPAD
ncbi:MAG: DUF736 domain-containing protein [Sphingosinicella sp.]|nr:DUF736 domain-containing protein [Sphingosinicella sp.]